MSLFEELKRRNVFRVGIAYAVTAWILIQALSIFLPTFEAPEWVMKVLSVLIFAGFPLVLLFAWAYELTPEGLKRDRDVDKSRSIAPQTGKKLNHTIMVLMAVSIAFLLYERFAGSGPGSVEPEQLSAVADSATDKAAIAGPDQKSIAVLPFDNRSRLEDDEFFVEGIHDDLLTNLARIGDLKVISRTSVAKYKDTEMSIPAIADELGVATVMEGAVQRAGSTVRINVQLIDAKTDEHLWAEIFDREMTAKNLFAIQSEISQRIAEALKAKLSPEEQQRINAKPTENLAAYNAYLRGRQLMARRSSESVDQAAAEFERAVDLDPEFALAWTSIAEVAALQMQYSDLDMLESIQIRRNATERAVALDDQLGEAHLSKATLLGWDELLPEAEAAYRRAIELSPNYATAYQWYADFLTGFAKRRREALAMLHKAAELDPLSSIIQVEIADTLLSLGKYPDAERQLNHVLELDPGFAPAYAAMAELMGATGRMDGQVRWIQKSMKLDPGRVALNLQLLWAYMDLGHTEAMLEIRQKMATINPDHLFTGFVDMLHAMYTGNHEASMESARWVNQRMGRQPWFQRIFGFLNNISGDYTAARASFEISDPNFFDRDKWRKGLENTAGMGCMIGWILLKTGEEELGNGLIDATEDYLVNELPAYVDHADRYAVDECHVVRGEVNKALDAIETRVAHKHYTQSFFIRKHPQFEPLWGHPRFEAAMQQIADDMTEQRENLARMETEAGP